MTPLPYTDIGWQRQQIQCWAAPMPELHEVGDAARTRSTRTGHYVIDPQ